MHFKLNKLAVGLLACSVLFTGVNLKPDLTYAEPALGQAVNNTSSESSSASPKLTVDRMELSLEEAKSNPSRTINVSVSGVDGLYSVTGIHIYWDSRLTAEKNKDGYYATAGSAVSALDKEFYNLENGVFAATVSAVDGGKDGVMYTLNFKLPSNVQAGDIYDISIVYEENEICGDLFTDSNDSEAGQSMQKYIFEKGIYNGYIKIKEPATTTSTTTTTTTTTSTTTTTTTGPAKNILYGDTDGDEKISAYDASLTLTEYAGRSSGEPHLLSGDRETAADVTNDGKIGADDASYILTYYTYLSGGGKEKDMMVWIKSNLK